MSATQIMQCPHAVPSCPTCENSAAAGELVALRRVFEFAWILVDGEEPAPRAAKAKVPATLECYVGEIRDLRLALHDPALRQLRNLPELVRLRRPIPRLSSAEERNDEGATEGRRGGLEVHR